MGTPVSTRRKWDPPWRGTSEVHVWLAINAMTPQALGSAVQRCAGAARRDRRRALLDSQDANAIVLDGKFTTKEHFGYTDGFGNPDYLGVCRDNAARPGQADAGRKLGAAGHRRAVARLCR